jgi:hypothetical protein
VALAVKLDDRFTAGRLGPRDGHVAGRGGTRGRLQVMTAWPMATLTADRRVGGLWAIVRQNLHGIGLVAEDAAPDDVKIEQRALIIGRLSGAEQAAGQQPTAAIDFGRLDRSVRHVEPSSQRDGCLLRRVHQVADIAQQVGACLPARLEEQLLNHECCAIEPV